MAIRRHGAAAAVSGGVWSGGPRPRAGPGDQGDQVILVCKGSSVTLRCGFGILPHQFVHRHALNQTSFCHFSTQKICKLGVGLLGVEGRPRVTFGQCLDLCGRRADRLAKTGNPPSATQTRSFPTGMLRKMDQ